VLCLDLDRFKTVNDTLGHPVGDALLKEAAARLVATTRATDKVARLGGDEFAVIRLPRQDEPAGEHARGLAERLIKVLAEPFKIDGQHIAIGVSIGIAESPAGSASPDTLLKNADLALYLAKSDGRGIYRVFEREMDAQIQAKRLLELDLRNAIAEQQFQLFYQPLLETATGRVVAFEALLRWHHPQRGFVSPAAFIPLAEETGLITELGLWVIKAACRDATTWPVDIKVAVDLSPLQFRCPTLLFDIALAMQRFGLAGNRLDIEITESLMLEDSVETLARLHELRSLGVGISMDDFGTGYSSLSYLRRFPFDKIKIDQSFIRNMVTDADGYAIVEAFVSLGRALHTQVVAEGIETREQLKLLRDAGCQQVQGYLFSHPQPVAELASLIERFAAPSPLLFGDEEAHHA
jgi:diguanylate cyclase (GGDEF)-like protein